MKKYNNIRKLRKKKNLTLDDLSNSIGIGKPTLSRYENNLRNPSDTIWSKLATIFNVSVSYVQGAYSQDEILEILQSSYKKVLNNKESLMLKNAILINELAFYVDLIMIAKGKIPTDTPKLSGMLSTSEINDFNFWKSNYSFIFESVATNWLTTHPIDVTNEEILKSIVEALQIEIAKLETTPSASSSLLIQRQNFINSNINDDGTLNLN